MKKILVATTNADIIATIQKTAENYIGYFTAYYKSQTQDVVNFINFEMPELKIIDFSCSDIDYEAILKTIEADPWLHYGGIIAIAKNGDDAKKIEERKDTNILIAQKTSEFTAHFSRLLRILWSNQQFLFNRGLQGFIDCEDVGAFTCANDPLDISFYSRLLVSYLFSTNRINDSDSYHLQTALRELMANALEHGNCEISYKEKTKWLEKGNNMLDLIAKKNKDPLVAEKKIHLTYHVTATESVFSIQDDGKGFDWKSQMEKKVELGLHGMGLKISQGMVSDLKYNDIGNKVTFTLKNQQNETNSIPALLTSLPIHTYRDNEVVCNEGEPTTDLFFILSGQFQVYSKNTLITEMTPNDIFIGEMAFLLDDRRSATVVSVGESRLIPISKDAFLLLIKQHPHYSVFLARLLAKRIVSVHNHFL